MTALSALTTLSLNNNQLESLSENLFAELSSLTQLFLRNNQLTSLSAGVFSRLSSLQYLYLDGNQLTSLPAGVFRGLSTPTLLWLQENTVDPLPLTVSLVKIEEEQFKAAAPAGAPFDIVLPLRVAGGDITGGTNSITIPAGSVESELLTVTRPSDTPSTITVDIGTLPELPADHQGYQLARSPDLPLEVISAPTDGTVCRAGDVLAPGESCTYLGTEATFSVLDDGKAQLDIPGAPAWFNNISIGGSLRISTTINDERYLFVAEALASGSWEIVEVGDSGDQQPEQSEQAGEPLTARFEALPASHDGSAFTFELYFSEEITISYVNVRDDMLDVTDGEVTRVRRLEQGSNLGWEITIEPESDADVSIVLSPMADCEAAGAACTADGRTLSNERTVIVPGPDPPEASEASGNEGGAPILTASTAAPLTEATLDGSEVLLTLNGGRPYGFGVYDAVAVSGIEGVTIFTISRTSDTQVTVRLEFDGDFDTDAILTFTVAADAIANYNGPGFTEQIPVTAHTESIVASTAAPLTEATLDGSEVLLTLSGGRPYGFGVYDAVTVSGIEGVTIFTISRTSDTQVTVRLEFDGDFDTDAILTFTVAADAIADYNGPGFTEQIPVTAHTESIVASTAAPLTEATLDGSEVLLTLSGGRPYGFGVYDAVTVSGIEGVTIFTISRTSDTQVTVRLEFDGDFDTDAILTFTVAADAIADYNGPGFTEQIPVTAHTESIVASTAAPLTEATLDGSEVLLTLSGGRPYGFGVYDAVTVSGIEGVTIFTISRTSDTQVTVRLEFDGDFDTDAILTFTVAADAIANYNGPPLTAQIPVTAIRENALAANFPNPFNPETWISYQLAEPTEVTLTIYAVNGQVVRRLALGHQSVGTYAAYWDGRSEFGQPVASGVYFYTLTAGDFIATRKMLIQK